MSSALPDAFERLAAQCGLRVDSEPILAAPRDVLTPLQDVEQHYLVAISRSGTGAVLQIVFTAPAPDWPRPTVRDVLWWLAADAWAVERSAGTAAKWAETYGYPPEADAALALFRQHAAQAIALRELLGRSGYDSLLALYQTEISPSARR